MENTKNIPTHKLYQIRDRGEDRKSVWTEVGVGFTNRDGSINLLFNAIPLSGKVQLRTFERKEVDA